MRSRLVLVLFGLFSMLCAEAIADESITVTRAGRMVDEADKPMGGVFPMIFRLHPDAKSRRVIWTETHWVAVDLGNYSVRLGAMKPLPAARALQKAWMSVEVRGVGVVAREPWTDTASAATTEAAPEKGAPSSKGDVRFAEASSFAAEASHAKNSDKLQDMTAADIIRKAGEERSDVTVGTAKRPGNKVGGPGGRPFEETCPKGYVMTGIKGASATYLDSIQIICSPLE